jgi:FtsP/CotA-like multicopper oxidase with cupredoxin domain
MIYTRCFLSAAALLTSLLLTDTSAFANDTSDLPIVSANNNRTPAGVLKDGQLTLRLEVSKARWYPDRETDPSIALHAFGEEGKPPQIPGPLVRVPEGTQIVATVRNLLSRNVLIHGLHERPGSVGNTVEVAAGATREVRFKAGKAGTYTYWATTTESTLRTRATDDTQLSGAFVVDQGGKMPLDRIFVLGLWLPNPLSQTVNVATINGKSWPFTERLAMRVGESASWRVINGSADWHAMHLHGFHFSVATVGDGETDQPYAPGSRPSVVTQQDPPGGSIAMTCIAERAGNWMFHCQMTVHMSRQSSLKATQAGDHQEHESFAAGMSGLVLGITVEGENTTLREPVALSIRHLRLHLRERPGGWPSFGIEVQEPDSPAPKMESPLPLVGPPVILTRGQPVEIEVVNHLKEPTAIHWHGMELESYYDGVPGFGGDALRTTPAILPGESFIAKMNPPEAGTFIYHTHWHDEQQVVNGLYGPLIVLEPGEKFDADHDKIFVFSFGKFLDPLGLALLLNGTPQPFQVRLRTGEKYRFRLINITANAVDMEVSLSSRGAPVEWKKLAKDGRDLPATLKVTAPAREVLTVGETRDFEFQSDRAAELRLEGLLPRSMRRVVLALVFEDKEHRD